MERVLALRSYLNSLDPAFLRQLDQNSTFPQPIFKEFHRLGIMNCALSPSLGGAGVNMQEMAQLASELGYFSPGLFSGWAACLLGTTAISLFAQEEIKQKILATYSNEKQIMSFCFTEPDAGTDAELLSTTFSKTANGYVLNGNKHLITNINHAHHYVVFARPKDKNDPIQTASAFYVDSTANGITVGVPFEKMGHRESNTGSVTFTNVHISRQNLLAEHGAGIEILSRCISRTKTLIAAAAAGLCRKANEITIDYLSQRVLYGMPLIKRADIRAQLADFNVRMEAAWLLTLNAGRAWDNGNAIKEASMAKYYSSMVAVEFVSKAMELCGGLAYLQDHPMSKMYRDAKLFEIYEGASLVQLSIVARETLRSAHKIEQKKAA